MANEEAKPQNDVKEQNLQRYESMLTEYKEMKEHWENVVKSGVKNAGNVSTENIFQLIKELYELPIYGNKIREAAIIQNKAYYHETHRGQVVHRSNIMNIGERSSWTSLLSKTLTKMFQ
jgi:tRNA pseudouridine-54 N-methylase